MPDAIADGWLIAIIAIFVSVALPSLRWVASKWREPLEEALVKVEKLQAENTLLKEQGVSKTEAFYNLQIENMMLQTKLEICENNVDNWESGRWRREE